MTDEELQAAFSGGQAEVAEVVDTFARILSRITHSTARIHPMAVAMNLATSRILHGRLYPRRIKG